MEAKIHVKYLEPKEIGGYIIVDEAGNIVAEVKLNKKYKVGLVGKPKVKRG